jgi:xanthine dehydrogenase YagT iron-sulfur-binding subunit
MDDAAEQFSHLGKGRRVFLRQLGAAGIITASAGIPRLFSAEERSRSAAMNSADTMPGKIPVTLRINGVARSLELEPRAVLLDVLREQLQLTGTKKGCDHGQCGACTVMINGRRVKSCLSLAVMHDGEEVTTIEGLEHDGKLHAMQSAFMDCDAFQCGGCTSGQIMSAVAMLTEPVGPDDASVREAMSGNICRCGAYKGICEAIQSVRQHATAPARST